MTTAQTVGKVKTEHVYPPIPTRSYDWCAYFDSYEPGCKIGYGSTKDEAIEDLINQVEEE